MAAAQDAFQGAISVAVRLLVADVEGSLQPHLLAYARVRWGEEGDVSEESAHMNAMLRKLGKVAEFWKGRLLPLYVRFTCDKLVSSLMPRFLCAVQRCKRLGDNGAQQLLLDLQVRCCMLLLLLLSHVHAARQCAFAHLPGEPRAPSSRSLLQALKGALLELPAQSGASSTSAYTKMVSAEVGKAEQLLRLVLAPEEALAVRAPAPAPAPARAQRRRAKRAPHRSRPRAPLRATPSPQPNPLTRTPTPTQEHFNEMAAGLAGAGGIGLDLTRVLELKGVRRPEISTSAISLLEELKGGVSSSAANASLSQGSQKIKKLLNIS